MFLTAVKNIVTEPKWMVGLEWEMINVIRDIYCRLVLGQILQPGGQGPAVQQPKDPLNPMQFEQAKTADRPLQGGGILVLPSDIPRQILASLPGIDESAVRDLEAKMNRYKSAKEQVTSTCTFLFDYRQVMLLLTIFLPSSPLHSQKDFLRDLLRIAAENSAPTDGGRGTGIFDRAIKEESLLNQKVGKIAVPDIPEKLITHSMVQRREAKSEQAPQGFGTNLFS
jgi:hypothetical protein